MRFDELVRIFAIRHFDFYRPSFMATTHPDIIAAALRNPKVDELYQRVSSSTSIQFRLVKGFEWASMSNDGQTTIDYSPCLRPAEALAHELLHAQLKLDGYKQYCSYVAKAPCPQIRILLDVLPAIDNEMQHHRMYECFTDLGFDLKYFYADEDADAILQVRRRADKLQGKGSTVDFFMLYLTLIARGGVQSDAERSQAKAFLLNKATADCRRKLHDAEAVIERWTGSTSLDAGQYVKELLNLLELSCEFWVGTDGWFPRNGFFTGAAFQVEEIERR